MEIRSFNSPPHLQPFSTDKADVIKSDETLGKEMYFFLLQL